MDLCFVISVKFAKCAQLLSREPILLTSCFIFLFSAKIALHDLKFKIILTYFKLDVALKIEYI